MWRIAQHDALERVALRGRIVTPEPSRLDHIAVGRRGVLLVLGGKDPTADLAFQLLDCLGIVAPRLQQLPGRAMVDLILAHSIIGRFDSDGGDHQPRPALLDQDARRVVDMKPLHGDHDEALRAVIEPAEGSVAEPIERGSTGDFRARVVGLDGIVDD